MGSRRDSWRSCECLIGLEKSRRMSFLALLAKQTGPKEAGLANLESLENLASLESFPSLPSSKRRRSERKKS